MRRSLGGAPTRQLSSNRHMAAFARHRSCSPREVVYTDGRARCEGCGASWAIDVSVNGYRFVPAVHPGLVDAR